MTSRDWSTLAVYIFPIIVTSWLIGKRQKTQEDCYPGGLLQLLLSKN